jgi:hypothetical protein
MKLSPDDKVRLLDLCHKASDGELKIGIELMEPRRYVLAPNGSAENALANAQLWAIARQSILSLLEELSQRTLGDEANRTEATDVSGRSDQLAASPPGVSESH